MANSAYPKDIYVDSNISVPENIRNVKRPSIDPGDNDTAVGPDEDAVAVEVGGTGSVYFVDPIIDADPVPGIPGDFLAAPGNITVVSQTARVVNGQVVIDVVIEVDDVPGAVSYEPRYTKA